MHPALRALSEAHNEWKKDWNNLMQFCIWIFRKFLAILQWKINISCPVYYWLLNAGVLLTLFGIERRAVAIWVSGHFGSFGDSSVENKQLVQRNYYVILTFWQCRSQADAILVSGCFGSFGDFSLENKQFLYLLKSPLFFRRCFGLFLPLRGWSKLMQF